ncbi:hypothetical protein Pan14r_38720 [Crateriforma conspicua]|uniref:Uncharacterized protein n=1 Tax=Crateriforma conspicua TaxID=2527996 RepID=A0A5C5YE37_9PLAN|nr:hypothetical protein Pan14r_38720 [Crateriforma conspicua]
MAATRCSRTSAGEPESESECRAIAASPTCEAMFREFQSETPTGTIYAASAPRAPSPEKSNFVRRPFRRVRPATNRPSRAGQTLDNPAPFTRDRQAPRESREIPLESVSISAQNRRHPHQLARQNSLTRESAIAANRGKATKKAGVLRFAKRRLSEFTPGGQFPNQTEKLWATSGFQTLAGF